MQDYKTILENLQKHAEDKDYKYRRIYRNFYNSLFYTKVLDDLKNNRNDYLSEEELEALIDSFRSEKYKPNRVDKNITTKKGELVYRPSREDRVVEKLLTEILELIFKDVFSKSLHSSKNNRSVHTAIKEIEKFRFCNYFIIGNLDELYDKFNPNNLDKALSKRIEDQKFIRLINKFVKKGYLNDFTDERTYSKTLTRSKFSDLLVDIYFILFDEFMENLKKEYDLGKVKRVFSQEYLEKKEELSKLSQQIDNTEDLKRRKELIELYKKEDKKLEHGPKFNLKDPEAKELRYVRYRDVFIVGIRGSFKDAETIKDKILKFLEETYSNFSEESLILKDKTKKFHFLEYAFEFNPNTEEANPYLVPKVPIGKIEEFILKKAMVKDIDQRPWKPIHRGYLLNMEDYRILRIYNAEVRGLYLYYSLAENVSRKLGQYRYVSEYSCLKTYARKFRTTLSKIRKRYHIGHEWGIKYQDQDGNEKELLFFKGFKRRFSPILSESLDYFPSIARNEFNPKRKKRRRLT